MQNNNWQKIEEIFNCAVVLPVAERRRFVEETCNQDPELRDEIISLIDSDCLEDSFIDEPVFTLGAQLLENDFSEFLNTENFGVYKLQKLLGRGGMGAVFLAEDTRLGRFVALKILPPLFADNEEMIARFRQEARLASSISHPNVAHIYEFNQYDGRYFIAMEYVRGETLRDLIKGTLIDFERAVEISLQIAAALDAAHKIGIVHHDIKPENLMVTEDGLVKTLDFGISKLSAQSTENPEFNTGKQISDDVTSGALRGTVAYMSPEQLNRQPIDARTDLWSLGVVLYEMLTGKRPFDATGSLSLPEKILTNEPANDLPPPFADVVRKALQKNKSDRYQTAGEFAADLNSAKRLITDSSEKLEARKSFLRTVPGYVTLLVALIAVLSSSWLIFQFWGKTTNSQNLMVRKSIRLNLTSKARSTALSPTGRWLAYSFEEEGKIFLVLKPNDTQVNSATTEKTLVESNATRIAGLAFSPDEQFVYYTLYETDKIYADLYRVTVNGGEPQKLLSKIENAPSFSPDGSQIVFLRLGEDESHESLIVADADGQGERILYTRRMPEYITHLATPAWSPDGTTVLCAAGRYGADKRQEVFPMKINVADAQSVPAFNEPWHEIWQTAWLADGKSFMMIGRKESADINKQLWQVNTTSGTITRLTDDFNDYFGLSVARKTPDKAVQIGTLVLDRATDLWITEIGGKTNEARQITSNSDNSYGVSWASSNRIVYGSVAGNNYDIWSINPDGEQRRQITFEPARDSYPTFLPDGSRVFFISERDGVKSLWRVNPDGSEPVLMVRGVSSQPFAVSPDGKWIYFHSYFSGAAAFWRISTSGSEPEKIIDGTLENPAVAPDNQTIAAVWTNEEGNSKLAVFNLQNPVRENWQIFDLIAGANPSAATSPTALRWTADGKAIAYVAHKKGVGNIWEQPIDGKPKQLTNFTTARLWSFDFSPDGKQIICSRGDQLRFVTLIQLGESVS